MALACNLCFENVRVFFYENLIDNPSEFLRDLYDFIGVDHTFKANTSKVFNASGAPKNKFIQKILSQENLLKKISRPVYHKVFGKKNVERFRDQIRDTNVRKESLDIYTRNALQKLYAKDINHLQELMGNSVKLNDLWK